MHSELARRHVAAERRSHDLLRPVTQNPLDGGVGGREAEVEVERGDDVVCVVHQGAIALLAVRERLHRRLAVGDVQNETDAALGLSTHPFPREGHPAFDEDPP